MGFFLTEEKINKGIKLDIGCGDKLQEGWYGIDKGFYGSSKFPNFVKRNLEDIPWPLPDNCVIELKASHILEHICPKRIIDIFNEIHRVCKDKAIVKISVPLGGTDAFVQDPTHCCSFNRKTFEYFDPEFPFYYNIYRSLPFKLLGIKNITPETIYVELRVIKE